MQKHRIDENDIERYTMTKANRRHSNQTIYIPNLISSEVIGARARAFNVHYVWTFVVKRCRWRCHRRRCCCCCHCCRHHCCCTVLSRFDFIVCSFISCEQCLLWTHVRWNSKTLVDLLALNGNSWIVFHLQGNVLIICLTDTFKQTNNTRKSIYFTS